MEEKHKQHALLGCVACQHRWLKAEVVEMFDEEPLTKGWVLEALDVLGCCHLWNIFPPPIYIMHICDIHPAGLNIMCNTYHEWAEKQRLRGRSVTSLVDLLQVLA